jgi:hypothetical protein
MNRVSRFLLLSGSLGLFLLQTPLRGQEVPSPSQILGYELGEKFTPVAGISRTRAFEPSNGFESVAFFPQDLSKISGVLTEESLDRLGQSSWLAQIGVGRVRRKVSPGPNH